MTNQKIKRIQEVQSKATLIFDEHAIGTALDKMATEITAKLQDTNPLFMCVLLGAIVPLGNLLPRLKFPLEIDYAHLTRYDGKTYGGEISWKAYPSIDLKDRTVVIFDDILDHGVTVQVLKDYCLSKGAKDVFVAVLIDKHTTRANNGLQKADFVGLPIEDEFVFGYGLDYERNLRNAAGIYAVAPEHQ